MAEGENQMKTGIHPQYHKTKVTCISCGNEFETGSTKKEIRVDTCSNCHPFFTGEQKFVQAAGRIDRFMKRASYAKKETK
jgi:large subunit ribosomal protein L31